MFSKYLSEFFSGVAKDQLVVLAAPFSEFTFWTPHGFSFGVEVGDDVEVPIVSLNPKEQVVLFTMAPSLVENLENMRDALPSGVRSLDFDVPDFLDVKHAPGCVEKLTPVGHYTGRFGAMKSFIDDSFFRISTRKIELITRLYEGGFENAICSFTFSELREAVNTAMKLPFMQKRNILSLRPN